MTAFRIGKNKTGPSLQMTLLDGLVPVPLTGRTVKFVMRQILQDGVVQVFAPAVKVNADAVVVDVNAGTVRYDWATGDTDTEASFRAHWDVTDTATGRVVQYPDKGFNTVVVTRALN